MAILTQTDINVLLARLGSSTVLTSADITLISSDCVPRSERMVKEHLGFEVEQATWIDFLPNADQRTPESPLDERYIMGGLGNRTRVATPVSEIMTNHYPLRSVISTYENQIAWETDPVNGDFSSGFLLTYGADYTADFDEPGLSFSCSLKRSACWSPIRRTIKVTYVAGFTADELESSRWRAIKDAVLLTAQKFYLDLSILRRANKKEAGFGIVTSEKLDAWSASYNVGPMMNLLGMSSTLPPQAVRLLEKHVRMGRLFSI